MAEAAEPRGERQTQGLGGWLLQPWFTVQQVSDTCMGHAAAADERHL